MPGADDRRRRYKKGLYAETLCAWVLRLKGYRILARRYKTPVGEIDIVAKRGGVLAMVEVKARASRDAGAESVTPAAQRRIAAATRHFVAGRENLANNSIRFDVMIVVPWSVPVHETGAWQSEDLGNI